MNGCPGRGVFLRSRPLAEAIALAVLCSTRKSPRRIRWTRIPCRRRCAAWGEPSKESIVSQRPHSRVSLIARRRTAWSQATGSSAGLPLCTVERGGRMESGTGVDECGINDVMNSSSIPKGTLIFHDLHASDAGVRNFGVSSQPLADRLCGKWGCQQWARCLIAEHPFRPQNT